MNIGGRSVTNEHSAPMQKGGGKGAGFAAPFAREEKWERHRTISPLSAGYFTPITINGSRWRFHSRAGRP
jgi:hypothetical protein